MDIDKLIDEVVSRLMDKIRQEQTDATSSVTTFDTVSGATVTPGCKKTSQHKKQLITETIAMGVAKHSQQSYPKGTIITPLARDVFKQRGVTIHFE